MFGGLFFLFPLLGRYGRSSDEPVVTVLVVVLLLEQQDQSADQILKGWWKEVMLLLLPSRIWQLSRITEDVKLEYFGMG